MKLERRYADLNDVEGRTLSGLALPFEVETRIGTMRERFSRGSVQSSGEAILNVQHDRGRAIAREPSRPSTRLRSKPWAEPLMPGPWAWPRRAWAFGNGLSLALPWSR